MEAKALAQAAELNEAARALKRSMSACRDALHTVRRVEAALNGIEVETVPPAKPTEAKHGTTQDTST